MLCDATNPTNYAATCLNKRLHCDWDFNRLCCSSSKHSRHHSLAGFLRYFKELEQGMGV